MTAIVLKVRSLCAVARDGSAFLGRLFQVPVRAANDPDWSEP